MILTESQSRFLYIVNNPKSKKNPKLKFNNRIELIYFLDSLGKDLKRQAPVTAFSKGIKINSYRKDYFKDSQWIPLNCTTISYKSLLERETKRPETNSSDTCQSTITAILPEKQKSLKVMRKRVKKAVNLKKKELKHG